MGIITMNTDSIERNEILSTHFSGTPDQLLHPIPIKSANRARRVGYNKSVAKRASAVRAIRSNFLVLLLNNILYSA